MPRTDLIEAGLAPQGIGSPEPTMSVAPRPSLNLSALPTQTFGPGNVVQQTPQDRALQPWQVEDRTSYYRAKQAIAQQVAAQADAMRRQRQFEQAQAFVAEQVRRRTGTNPLQVIPQAQRNASIIDQENQKAAFARQYGITPGSFYEGALPLATDPNGGLGRAVSAIAGPLTTEIPGAQQVANVAGDVARNVANYGQIAASGPLVGGINYGVNKALGAAGLPQPEPIVRHAISNVAGFAAETLVPTEVWQAALELVPGIGTVPELARAVRSGAPEAITALTRASEKLGAREEVQTALKQIGVEQGAIKLPFGIGEKAAPEVAGKTTEELRAELIAQRNQISQAIAVLPKAEQANIVLEGLPAIAKFAARYDRGSVERQALSDAAAFYMRNLPEVDQKLARGLIDNVSSNAEARLATKAQRATQAERIAKAYEGAGSETERAIAARAAQSGKQAPRFEPIGQQFTGDEITQLESRIGQAADAKVISQFERPNAASALHLLLTGQRLPGIESEARLPLNLMPHERDLLGRIFGPEIQAVLPKTPSQLRSVSNWLNLPRALVTAIDISAAGRQGILLAARNPVEWAKSYPVMFQAMKSEEGFQRASRQLLDNPKFSDGLIHGLDITDIGGGVGAEEPYISSIAEKIPGVRASERGYVMFMNNLRMSAYEKYTNRLETLANRQNWDPARIDMAKSNLARFLNHATGRGTLPSALREYTPALNAVFFSPRFVVSRPQSVWDMVRPGTDKFSRQIAFENLGAFVGAGTSALYFAKAMGADVEVDPRSADFGRFKFGPTRIDFWGGFQPIARYIAQVATAKSKNTSTGIVGFADPSDTITRFVRSKLAPPGALVYDLTVGKRKDYAGNDILINPKDMGMDKETSDYLYKAVGQRLLPLSIQDAWNGYQTQGPLGALAAGGVSTLGGGVSSYEPTEKQQQTIEKTGIQKKLDAVGYSQIVPDTWHDNLAKIAQSIPPNELSKPVDQFNSIEELKADYLAPGPNEHPSRAQINARESKFNSLPAVKAYKEMIKAREVFILKKAPLADVQAAYDAKVIDLDADQRKALGVK